MNKPRWLAVAAGLLLFAAAIPAVVQETESQASLRVTRIGEMETARAAHQATLLASGEVLVTGGCGRNGCRPIHASAEIFDPGARSFRSIDAMTTPRSSHAAARLPDDRVLLVGGWTGEGATASAEVFDPATKAFTRVGNMNVARMSPVATPLLDGRVLITGGEPETGTALASAEIFDPRSNSFEKTGSMHEPRGSHVAVRLQDGRVLVLGGHRARGEVLRSTEIYDPASGSFVNTGEMAFPRHKHAAVLLADGRVLLVGGSDARDYRGRYASTEIYDPAQDRFSTGPGLQQPRHKIRDAVVTLASGHVLVAGGATGPELLDVMAEEFQPVAGSLSGPQMFATSSILPNGDVLVLGGYDDRIRATASAWIVDGAR